MEDEWTIKEWRVPSEPRVIYIKPEDVPVCLVEKDSGWKPRKQQIAGRDMDCLTIHGTRNSYMNTSRRLKMSLEKTNSDFDEGFDKWMSSAIERERLTRQGKPIPRKLQRRIDESSVWLHNLSDEEYSRLIH